MTMKCAFCLKLKKWKKFSFRNQHVYVALCTPSGACQKRRRKDKGRKQPTRKYWSGFVQMSSLMTSPMSSPPKSAPFPSTNHRKKDSGSWTRFFWPVVVLDGGTNLCTLQTHSHMCRQLAAGHSSSFTTDHRYCTQGTALTCIRLATPPSSSLSLIPGRGGGRVTPPIDSRKDHMRQGLV